MKRFVWILLLTGCMCGTALAQTKQAEPFVNKEPPTPANVLKWTTRLLPQMERVEKKIGGIQAADARDARQRDIYLTALRNLRAIQARGKKLSTLDAKTYHAWFVNSINSAIADCRLEHPGDECCQSCEKEEQGWSRMGCMATCFAARYPLL